MRTSAGKTIRRSTSGATHPGVAVVVFVLAALSATFVVATDEERRRIALAVPESAAKPTWDEERRAFATRLSRGYGLKESLADEFAGWILEAATRQSLEPELLASLVMTESSFRKHARSSVGAVGPAQVRPELWQSFCPGNLGDPEQNLYCGAQILAHYLDVCAHIGGAGEAEVCALRAYNIGYGNLDNPYFTDAARRYTSKIDRYRAPLNEV